MVSRLNVEAACILCCVAVGGVIARGAELTDRARQAYEQYIEQARRSFLERVRAEPLESRQGAGAISAQPGTEDGIISVPDGLVHHWVGVAFMPDVTLDAAIQLSQAYAEYPRIYASVVSSRTLGQDGDAFHIELRLHERAGVVTATLDVTSTVQYVRVDSHRAYSLSETTDIREIANAGRPDEHALDSEDSHGYLWRANTFTSYLERGGGLYVTIETLGLSRRFPPLLGWIIEPIARRLGRKSVEGSLREFREALIGSASRHTGMGAC